MPGTAFITYHVTTLDIPLVPLRFPSKRSLLSALGVALLVLGWALLSAVIDSFILPSPLHTAQEALWLLGRSHTWRNVGITLLRVFIGFSAAFVCGSVVGIAIGSREEVEMLCKPGILIVQGIPPILWAIPLILLLGTHPTAPMLVIALICFPLITLTVAEGMKSVPRKLVEMLHVFAPGRVPRIREVILPHLRPFFAASLKLGLMLGIKASVIAEYFGANNGIGFQIQVAYQSLQVRRLFGWGLMFVALILLFDLLLSRVERLSRGQGRRPPAIPAGRGLDEFERLRRLFLTTRACPPVVVENVAFRYQNDAPLLQHVNLMVNPHEIAVIAGDSGTGKTTLLSLIAGLLTPTSGRLTAQENLGFIFQDDRFLPWRTNAWNVALPLVYQGYSRASALTFAAYLLDEVGLHGEESKYPDELSGGMKKRLAFARCFARLPGAILMDEPFTGLHKDARDRLWEKFFVLLRLHPVPVIIVTHFPEEIDMTNHCRLYRMTGQPATLMAQS